MAGYVIADVEVTDPTVYEEYRKLVPPTIQKYGGKYVVRGGDFEVLEGDWTPHRLVVLEFESVERAREWYYSEEYTAARAVRKKSSNGSVIIVEGA